MWLSRPHLGLPAAFNPNLSYTGSMLSNRANSQASLGHSGANGSQHLVGSGPSPALCRGLHGAYGSKCFTDVSASPVSRRQEACEEPTASEKMAAWT